MMTLLRRWVRPRTTPDVAHLSVTVYTRAGCCCCHKAVDFLKKARRRHRFTIVEVDVDSDPALAEKYGMTVPVVAVDGKVRFKGVVNPILFDRLLVAERRGR